MAARKRKAKRNRGAGWEHDGGGCFLAAPGEPFPCDDDYTNAKTGQRVTILSTQAAHFKLPPRVRSLRQLKKRKGVNPAVIFRDPPDDDVGEE